MPRPTPSTAVRIRGRERGPVGAGAVPKAGRRRTNARTASRTTMMRGRRTAPSMPEAREAPAGGRRRGPGARGGGGGPGGGAEGGRAPDPYGGRDAHGGLGGVRDGGARRTA